MPILKKHHQETFDIPMAGFIFGHIWGAVDSFIGNSVNIFFPLSLNPQDGDKNVLKLRRQLKVLSGLACGSDK
ncbi:hypothetical protein V6C20_12280 [Caldibacillus thermoamylovorans]|jgi:hypothetical protein